MRVTDRRTAQHFEDAHRTVELRRLPELSQLVVRRPKLARAEDHRREDHETGDKRAHRRKRFPDHGYASFLNDVLREPAALLAFNSLSPPRERVLPQCEETRTWPLS